MARILPATAALLVALWAGGEGRGQSPVPPPENPPAGGKESTAPAVQVREKKQPQTLLDFAVAGGWMMVPLCLCSVLWVAFLTERLIALRRKKVVPSALVAAFRTLLREKPLDRSRARAILDAHPSTASKLLRAAMDRLDMPPEKIEKAVDNMAQREIYLLRMNIWIFAVIATVSPLIGLLGTVIGLVQAFREVAISGLGAGETLAPGIYEALVATIGGLAVAIPSVATYYWLHAKVDHYIHEVDGLVMDFVDAQDLSFAAA